ncbi:malectin-A-like [Anneissia japonica]|uniref:malectin-A-like n=1 Tax=Anneissia japonica TaxID=1529436 RepID=UPI001425A297|nr:malectin-A-like [Anneissia japonica]
MPHNLEIIFCIALQGILLIQVSAIGKVIFAVNSGGEAHTDENGIRYNEDTLTTGIISDFGRNMQINRVRPEDMILYQTERYHYETFGYDIPIKDDGRYVLILKFCEVYFTSSLQKVFNVRMNGQHNVVTNLDIYDKVGRGTAHDEIIPFTIGKGKLTVKGEASTIGASLSIEFVKGQYDNPKINAIVVMKGTEDDVPKLPPIPGKEENIDAFDEDEDDEDERTDQVKPKEKVTVASGPKTVDPYSSNETSLLFPILIAIGLFIPSLFCLCRL